MVLATVAVFFTEQDKRDQDGYFSSYSKEGLEWLSEGQNSELYVRLTGSNVVNGTARVFTRVFLSQVHYCEFGDIFCEVDHVVHCRTDQFLRKKSTWV